MVFYSISTYLERFEQKLILVVLRTKSFGRLGRTPNHYHSDTINFFYQQSSKIFRNAPKTDFRSEIREKHFCPFATFNCEQIFRFAKKGFRSSCQTDIGEM